MEIRNTGAHDSGTFSTLTSNAADTQVVGSSDYSHLKLLGSNGTRAVIGDLSYKLTGLLALQTLYTLVVKDNCSLRAQVEKLESFASRLRERLSSSISLVTENTESTSLSKLCVYEESEYRDGYSLLSDTFRSMQMKVTRLERMIHEIEGTSAKGLIQQTHDLREAYKHQLAVIEDLQREVVMYRRHWGSASDLVESGPPAGPLAIICELSKTEKLLSFERTLVVEVGKQLQEKIHEVVVLRQQLDFERYGRRQSQEYLSEIMSDFVRCCLDTPYVTKDTELKEAFQDLLSKSEGLAHDMRDDMTAAVQVAFEDGSQLDFFREFSLEEVQLPETMEEARAKLTELQALLRRFVGGAKRNMIDQMRKFKHASMKVKDLDEKLKKSEADRQLVEEQLGDEIRKQRTKLDHFEQTLGVRSSYATKASESVRALVELLDSQKVQLESQNKALKTELETYRVRLDSLSHSNTELERKMERLQTVAKQEATTAVQADLEALRSKCKALQQQALSSKERCELQDEDLKREGESRRSVEEQKDRLQSQVKVYEAEIRDHKANIASMVESNHHLSSQVEDLEIELRRLRSSIETLPSQQLEEPEQRVSGSVRYIGRHLPRPELISRNLTSSSQATTSVSEHSSISKRQQLNATIPSALLSSSVTTQSPPPAALAGYSQSSQSDSSSLGLSGASRYGSAGGSSSTFNRPFSSLSQVSGDGLHGMEQTGSDSGRPHSSVGGGQRHSLYSRSVSSRSLLGPQRRDTMQCLRCDARFPLTNLDGYEKHIRDCYSDVQ